MILLTLLLIALVAWGWTWWKLRRLRLSIVPDEKKNSFLPAPQRKCYVRTYTYSDGHVEDQHSVCARRHPSYMTDVWAQTMHPQAKLLDVRETVHYL